MEAGIMKVLRSVGKGGSSYERFTRHRKRRLELRKLLRRIRKGGLS